MKGKIIKGIAGFYYVHVPKDNKVYECKAKGIFRNQKIKPLVGDNVIIDTTEQAEGLGIITDILPRENQLIRPAVANIDQALIIFATAEPTPNLNLLDRFLVMMEREGVKTTICFNKKDIVTESEVSLLMDTYLSCGYKVVSTSALQGEGLSMIMDILEGKTTVLAGPSGVGKSSMINLVKPDANMEIGRVSEKIKRGKHTTRHSELFYVKDETYILDTPGFSSLYISEIETEELKDYYPEFSEYEEQCRFKGCNHMNEPGCAVKEALTEGVISQIRYDNYKDLFMELKDIPRY